MHIRTITPALAEYQEIRQLYESSFPENQRFPFERFQVLLKEADTSFLAFYDEDLFCGFTQIWHAQDYSIISYFAVNQALRSRGYGSRILDMIESLFPNQTIVVEIERLDEQAPNQAEREQRQKFYLRNGFKDVGYVIRLEDVVYDLYSNTSTFDPEQYYKVYGQLFPEHPYQPIKKE